MEAKLDTIDMSVINSLMQDGRKSFRQISRQIGVSTPTVESHFSKLVRLGVIKTIAPIIDMNKIQSHVSAFVFLKIANPSQTYNISNMLSVIPEVVNIYFMSGMFNLMVKLTADFPDRVEEIVRTKIGIIKGIDSITYELITRTTKDSHSLLLKEGAVIKMKCDYCDNEIFKNSKILKVGPYERHFCCPSCLTLYKQKYKGRIEALAK